jgi:hypothetical protein
MDCDKIRQDADEIVSVISEIAILDAERNSLHAPIKKMQNKILEDGVTKRTASEIQEELDGLIRKKKQIDKKILVNFNDVGERVNWIASELKCSTSLKPIDIKTNMEIKFRRAMPKSGGLFGQIVGFLEGEMSMPKLPANIPKALHKKKEKKEISPEEQLKNKTETKIDRVGKDPNKENLLKIGHALKEYVKKKYALKQEFTYNEFRSLKIELLKPELRNDLAILFEKISELEYSERPVAKEEFISIKDKSKQIVEMMN